MLEAADIIKESISEISRLQVWMPSIKEKHPKTYDSMHRRYIELKVLLTSLGVDLGELDNLQSF